MKPFRFRAAAALDLRRKQEDAAQLVHAQAQREVSTADARVLAARAAAADAAAASASTERAGADAWFINWHRSWVMKLRVDVDLRLADAVIAAAAAAAAEAAMRKAHQRRRTLERLRDRGVERYAVELRREELKDMNVLAGARFLAATADQGDKK